MMAADPTHHRGAALRVVLAELDFPAPMWLVIAQAHSWGASPDLVDDLKRLPGGDYDSLDDVLRSLGYPVGGG